jgi:hypothetical protein
MTKRSSKERKLIRAPGDLVSKLNEAANRQGETLYSYISEILEQAVRAYQMKRSLKEIIDRYELQMIHEEAGATFIPRDVLDYLIEKVYGKNGEDLQKLWYQTGRWYGICLKENLKKPVETFNRLLKDGRWDLSEVTVKRNEGTVEFRCVSTTLSQERTNLLQKFMEGTMHSIGYATLEQECSRGIIHLIFSASEVSPV